MAPRPLDCTDECPNGYHDQGDNEGESKQLKGGTEKLVVSLARPRFATEALQLGGLPIPSGGEKL
ncbi:MAG TPA: hypothetical protein VER96_28950 [Polyangiaceae bacterium]|nr:hypothetical protein [Polyangiaceae bacterium]